MILKTLRSLKDLLFAKTNKKEKSFKDEIVKGEEKGNLSSLKNLSLGSLFIPKELREFFSMEKITEKKGEWIVKIVEKRNQIPEDLKANKEKDIVLNGFCEPTEIVDFPFQGLPLYLRFYRRKWKIRGHKKSYFNQYQLHLPGMKTTTKFASFLKELTRQERREFFCAWPNIRFVSQEDF